MGENFVNYQIRLDSISDVTRVIKDITTARAYVSPPKNGWITVYDQTSDYKQQESEIRYLCQQLSSILSSAVFCFFVFSGLHFIYLLYDKGELVDEFFDNPDAFEFGYEQANDAVLERFQGQPERLLKYCLPGTKLELVSRILQFSREKNLDYMGQEAVYQLAILLGINVDRATIGYSYFEDDSLYNETAPTIEDAEEFILVQR